MGYYDKGTYDKGSYNPDEVRQTARDRYLDLLAKQQLSEQAMAMRMERDVSKKNKQIAQEEEDQSAQVAGDMAAKGGQGAYTMSGGNPAAAVIATIIGKGIGAVQHGQKYGAKEGAKAFFNPFSTPKAFLGQGGSGSQGTGAAMTNQVQEQNDSAKREKLLSQMQTRGDTGGPSSTTSTQRAPEMNMGQKFAAAEPTSKEDAAKQEQLMRGYWHMDQDEQYGG